MQAIAELQNSFIYAMQCKIKGKSNFLSGGGSPNLFTAMQQERVGIFQATSAEHASQF